MKDENKNSETLVLFLVITTIAFIVINVSKYLCNLYKKHKVREGRKR